MSYREITSNEMTENAIAVQSSTEKKQITVTKIT